MTDRMCAAMEHPLVDAIGHPTGPADRPPRALRGGRRPGDRGGRETGTFLEINANPNRRDLNDVYARAAAEAGAKIVIDSDAHGADTLGEHALRRGHRAARAGSRRTHVANTRPWDELAQLRKRGRRAL